MPRSEYSFFTDLPCCHGGPSGEGRLRSSDQDFVVTERLSFELSGEGEHVCLQIRKRGANTDYVAGQLARFAGVARRDVGYAGLKDRHAVTTQWFSVRLPVRSDPDWQALPFQEMEILQIGRHARKIKRGALAGNDFQLVIRGCTGDRDRLEEILQCIRQYGVANYFAEQRFGHHGRNLQGALQLFQGRRCSRQQRSMYLSAARSLLFNQILARRVENGTWDQAVPGDAMAFAGSRQYFKSGLPDQELMERVGSGKIHPTGALWGIGDSDVSADALAIEQSVVADYAEFTQGLEQFGVEMARRALRVNVENLQWWFLGETDLQLHFSLPSGSYATAVVRELMVL